MKTARAGAALAVLGLGLGQSAQASLIPQAAQQIFQLNPAIPLASSSSEDLSLFSKWQADSHGKVSDDAGSLVRIGLPGLTETVVADLEDLGLDIWQVRPDFVDVRLQSGSDLEKRYDNLTILIPSIRDLIQAERINQLSAIPSLAAGSLASPDTGLHSLYHPYSAIENMLKMFASDYPDFAKLEEIGKSAEGRKIYSLRISDFRETEGEHRSWRPVSHGRKTPAEKGKRKKKLDFAMIGGQHAREWISPATLLYVAHSFLASTTASVDEEIEDVMTVLSDYELHFIPIVNPDGYVYTWEHDRLWQKNRQTTVSDNPRCRGIDLNRNWEYKFERPQRPVPCSDLYPGTKPFEAVELQVLSDYLRRIKQESGLHVFADVHSFGQMLMYPFSYSCSVVPHDAENLFEALLGAGKAIRSVHKQSYDVGSACDVSYIATGQSLDWTYHTINVKWSFTFNLRDQGVHAFLLPPDQIVESGEELFAGIVDLAEFIAKKEKVEE